ncbi:MAG: quinolinate synthase NadA [Rikenellaceae bacterium]
MAYSVEEKIARISELKKKRGAIILSHFYTDSHVQSVADFVGDSLALAVEAKRSDAPVLLFAGVHFMAETAKVLSPEKVVLIPSLEAGCSLADSCKAEDLERFKRENPEHFVVAYVNTSVDVKCHTDICCTSSNALKVVESIDKDIPVLFLPDRNLGGYIKRMTGRENMTLWDGFCHVHEAFDTEVLAKLKGYHSDAEIVVHPECREEVAKMADYIGSTAGMIDYCLKSESKKFIVVTEQGILSELQSKAPSKTFISLDITSLEDCAIDTTSRRQRCAVCEYMKMITLDNIIEALENMTPEVTLSEETIEKASTCINRMLEIK